MKKALLVVAAAALLFSCNTKKQKEEAVEATAQQIDSLKNALKEASVSSCLGLEVFGKVSIFQDILE